MPKIIRVGFRKDVSVPLSAARHPSLEAWEAAKHGDEIACIERKDEIHLIPKSGKPGCVRVPKTSVAYIMVAIEEAPPASAPFDPAEDDEISGEDDDS